jgi:hypothetical protein
VGLTEDDSKGLDEMGNTIQGKAWRCRRKRGTRHKKARKLKSKAQLLALE